MGLSAVQATYDTPRVLTSEAQAGWSQRFLLDAAMVVWIDSHRSRYRRTCMLCLTDTASDVCRCPVESVERAKVNLRHWTIWVWV